MTLYPRDSGPGGLFCFFSSLRPALSISPGLIRLLYLSMPPLPQSPGGLFCFFASLRPDLPIFPGLIWLLFLSAPRSLNRPGAYSASLPLYAPLSRSARGLFGFFSSLRPAPSIDPGLIQLLYLSTPRSLNRPRAYSASLPLYAPLSRSARGLFGFFSSLRPALSIFPGLNLLLFLSAPRSPNCLGA